MLSYPPWVVKQYELESSDQKEISTKSNNKNLNTFFFRFFFFFTVFLFFLFILIVLFLCKLFGFLTIYLSFLFYNIFLFMVLDLLMLFWNTKNGLKKAPVKGWSPPQELEVSPCMGLYLLLRIDVGKCWIIWIQNPRKC